MRGNGELLPLKEEEAASERPCSQAKQLGSSTDATKSARLTAPCRANCDELPLEQLLGDAVGDDSLEIAAC